MVDRYEGFDQGPGGAAITTASTTLDVVYNLNDVQDPASKLAMFASGPARGAYSAAGDPVALLAFRGVAEGESAEAWGYLISTNVNLPFPPDATATSTRVDSVPAAWGAEVAPGVFGAAAGFSWAGNSAFDSYEGSPWPDGPGLYRLPTEDEGFDYVKILPPEAVHYQWCRFALDPIRAGEPATGSVSVDDGTPTGALIWSGVVGRSDVYDVGGGPFPTGLVTVPSTMSVFDGGAPGAYGRTMTTAFVDDMSILNGRRTAVRQWPRDDTAGINPAPRLYPPPRRARVFGGYR